MKRVNVELLDQRINIGICNKRKVLFRVKSDTEKNEPSDCSDGVVLSVQYKAILHRVVSSASIIIYPIDNVKCSFTVNVKIFVVKIFSGFDKTTKIKYVKYFLQRVNGTLKSVLEHK